MPSDGCDRLQQSEERQRTLLEINNAIITNLQRGPLFDEVVKSLARVIPFDRASLVLHEPESDLLKVCALAGAPVSKYRVPIGVEFPLKGSHLEDLFVRKRPRICSDLKNKDRNEIEDRILQEGIRSGVAVPLISRSGVLGILNVGSRTPNAYCENDAEFLLEVGKQVALAIENLLAYEQIAELKTRLERENLYLLEEIKSHHGFDEMIGQSTAIKEVKRAIETVASTNASVLIRGETGTGKELVARAIHNLSPQKDKALVKVNCAALPAGIIENELFGHEREAFTGAVSRQIGRFELANGGSIFLDEIGDLSPELQGKLLRVLQDGEFERLGSTQTIKVDVRVISATHHDLEKGMQEGRFRPDLFYRLNVFPIRIPPLRERREDIPHLANYFLKKFRAKLSKKIETIPNDTMEALVAYSWPGNIRELANVIERAVITSQGSELEICAWASQLHTSSQVSRVPTLLEHEREYILKVLDLTDWKVRGRGGAAEILGIKPTTLESRMTKLGISRTT